MIKRILLFCSITLIFSAISDVELVKAEEINDPDIVWADAPPFSKNTPKELYSAKFSIGNIKASFRIPGLPYLKDFEAKLHIYSIKEKKQGGSILGTTLTWCSEEKLNAFIVVEEDTSSMMTIVNEMYTVGYIKALILSGVDYCSLRSDKDLRIEFMDRNWSITQIREANSEVSEIFQSKNECPSCDPMRRIKKISNIENYALIHFLGVEKGFNEKQYIDAIGEINQLVVEKAAKK